jgi:hypothetical protein
MYIFAGTPPLDGPTPTGTPNRVKRLSIFSNDDTLPMNLDGSISEDKDYITVQRTFSDPQKIMNSNIPKKSDVRRDSNGGVSFENKDAPPENRLTALVYIICIHV